MPDASAIHDQDLTFEIVDPVLLACNDAANKKD
jgi:hypothetical protein